MLVGTLVLGGCNSKAKVEVEKTVKQSPADIATRLMRSAMALGDWEAANEHCQKALVLRPDDIDLLTDAAKIAAFSDRKRDAANLLVDALELAGYQPASRVDFAVQALIDVGELYRAIEVLDRYLDANPNSAQHRRTLVGFLAEAQRTEKIPPHLQKLIQARAFDVLMLVGVTENTARRFSSRTDDRLMKRNPHDHRVRLGAAHELLNAHDAKQAEEVLKEILDHHPTFAPAHAMLGQALMELQKFDLIPKWQGNAPADSADYANYWLTLGDFAAENEQQEQAIRAYWEAGQRDPNNSMAWTRMARSMREAIRTKTEHAADFTDERLALIEEQSADLLALRYEYYSFVNEGRKSQTYANNIAEWLLKLGRTWEAEAWSAAATTLTDSPTEELAPLRERILSQLKSDKSWQSVKRRPVLAINFKNLPMPKTNKVPRFRVSEVTPAIATADHLKLSEESSQWGLAGIGGKNNPSDARLAALIRSTGVGGGAIDFDLDGWQDVLVMSAGGTALKTDSMPNDLMRNLGGRFEKVTVSSGILDTHYGQGVGIGDYNEDGFPDLFFASLGTNRLFRNNGDGTFSPVALASEMKEWSTCGAFVDLNQDGKSDLLTLNYCDTVPRLDQPCPNEKGEMGPCHPLKFPAHADQFFVSTGDGQLKDMTETWIPEASPARGLGMVAGKLDSQSMGVFIANDMSANMFYSYSGSDDSPLIESAAARGVAVDGRTLAQASMGIASSDFDGDGDLDFYVTGFGAEYNIYYEQVVQGVWRDETSRVGLVEPTLPMVGFGTEAIDMDNDGIDEIIVTNGHIGEFNEPDSLPYEQPLQLFRRSTSGKFELVEDDAWGDYFRTAHVGRALWTTDVDRDGRCDVLITHTYEQLRLLINQTETKNSWLAVQLVGTASSRDSVGAILRFRCDGRERTLWQLAGDGYMCSNEHLLRAGLGEASQVEDVEVVWPDGTVQNVGTLAVNKEYVIVQGSPEAFSF